MPGAVADRHETDVASELQCIAERLLGVQQYGSSSQRLTLPLRLGEFTLAPRSLGQTVPAEFIFPPSFLELPLQGGPVIG